MVCFAALSRACSVIAIAAVALGACATHDERAVPRYGSIKDDPVDKAPAPSHRVVHRSAPATPVHKTVVAEPAQPSTPVTRTPVDAPSPRLPVVDKTPPPAVKVIDQAGPKASEPAKPEPAKSEPSKSASLEQRPVATAPPPATEPKTEPKASAAVEQPRVTAVEKDVVVTTPRAPVVIKPAETRPTVEQRRQEPSAAPQPKPTAPPAALPAAPTNAAAPVAQPVPLPKPTQPAQAPSTAPTAKAPEAKVETKVAVLTEDQRVAEVLTRADTYMKAGRYQDARTSLLDAANSGNPRLVTALAETYDPLVLREQYPRLSRTGDPERALTLYEQAKSAGAKNLDARITALKALIPAKR